MRFRIRHRQSYTYSAPVFLEPHTIRMCPRSDWRQQCLHYQLAISPEPAGHSRNLDLDGNPTDQIWFNGLTDSLEVTATSIVETTGHNPFDYLLDTEAGTLPFSYPKSDGPRLQAYLNTDAVTPSVRAFADACAGACASSTLSFPSSLADAIYHHVRYIQRPEGDPFSPETTLDKKEGSCRDVAVLFIACARAMGIAARFVTGYYDPEERGPELHAWAELYLPGGGWRGFDPSSGLAISDDHITLSAAPESPGAATISGTTRRASTHTLTTDLQIEKIAS